VFRPIVRLTAADLATARRLLGKDAIIGVTASSAEEALQAANAGADYLGIGTVFATPTSVNLIQTDLLFNRNSLASVIHAHKTLLKLI